MTTKKTAHSQEDHDLLIRIDTKLGVLVQRFDDHQSEALGRIRTLEELKLGKNEAQEMRHGAEMVHSDHEQRLRRQERYTWLAIGALSIMQISWALFSGYFLK